MVLSLAQYGLGGICGLIAGFALGLFGGGGSTLSVPLLVYLVGIKDTHLAVGTSAVAVAVNALAGLAEHARHGHVKWKSAWLFSAAGVVAALVAAEIGKSVDGRKLLLGFALLMAAVGIVMLRTREDEGDPDAECTRRNAPKLIGYGLGTGALSGFFGVGGGFLIVPGLIAAIGMPMINAVGTSLLAVAVFSLATAASYALSGFVNWTLALVFVIGGSVGSQAGCLIARGLEQRKGTLKTIFACLIFVVAACVAIKALRGGS